jgi:hypothetical protein
MVLLCLSKPLFCKAVLISSRHLLYAVSQPHRSKLLLSVLMTVPFLVMLMQEDGSVDMIDTDRSDHHNAYDTITVQYDSNSRAASLNHSGSLNSTGEKRRNAYNQTSSTYHDMLAVRAVADLVRTESGQTIVLPKVFYSDVIASSYNPHHAAAAVIADGDTTTYSSNACSSSSTYYCTTGLLPQVS